MSNISIIGGGHIGGTIASFFRKAGHQVAVRTHDDRGALPDGVDLVVLAVPWTQLDAVAASIGPVNGTIVVDATNPFSASYEPVRPAPPFASGGEQNAARFAGARLVKAFNSLTSDDLRDRSIAVPGARTALALCGDDEEAKAIVAGLIEASGFAAVDLGPLAASALTEPGGFYFTRVLTPTELRNAEIARTFVERVLARGDLAVFDQLVADDIVVNSGISPLAPMIGKAAFGAGLGALAAFSEGELHLEDVIPAGDRVTVRYTAFARHTGDQLGVPATGKRIKMWEIRLMRIAAGKIVEDFVADVNYDWPWLVAPRYRDAWFANLT